MKAAHWIWRCLWPVWMAHAMAQPSRGMLQIGGVTVVYHRLPKKTVAVQVLFRGGGARYAPPGKEGIGLLALATLLRSGTRQLPRQQFYQEMARYDIRTRYYARYEYAGIEIQYFAKADRHPERFVADIFLAPHFDSAAFEEAKKDVLQLIEQRREDLQVRSMERMSAEIAREWGMEYRSPYGTEASIRSITLDEVRHYYQQRMQRPEEVVVSIVGGFDPARMWRWLEAILQNAPRSASSLPVQEYPTEVWFHDTMLRVLPDDQSLPFLAVVWGGVGLEHWDYPALFLAFMALEDRFVLGKCGVQTTGVRYLRTDELSDVGFPLALMGLYIQSPYPLPAAAEMKKCIDEWRAEGISATELVSIQSLSLTQQGIDQWSSAGLAMVYAHYQLVHGDWQARDKMLGVVRSLSVEQVNSAIRRYLRGMRWYYVGDPVLVSDTAVFYSPPPEK